mmetsp:Transcript_29955/g.82227  ORF Transcript_29955/g.82227 Transcript_29955/m.82227 type:complete len:127 (+) Transcript_29955:67-447(+)
MAAEPSETLEPAEAAEAPAMSPGLLEMYMEKCGLTREQVLAQKAAFDALDIDLSGQIRMDEVKKQNANWSMGMSDEELAAQFSELDVNGDGGVSFQEFLKVYVMGEYGRQVDLTVDDPDALPPSAA